MGSHSLLQGVFSTQGPNPGLLHCRQILYNLSHQGRPLASNSLNFCFCLSEKIFISPSFFLRFFFLMWTILKFFIEFVTILLLLYVLGFWPWGIWGLTSPTRDQTCILALEGEVLTTGPPGKSLSFIFWRIPLQGTVFWGFVLFFSLKTLLSTYLHYLRKVRCNSLLLTR